MVRKQSEWYEGNADVVSPLSLIFLSSLSLSNSLTMADLPAASPSDLSPRDQALLAAEQRAKQVSVPHFSSPDQAHQSSESPFNPTRNDILVFSRIMDSQVRFLLRFPLSH